MTAPVTTKPAPRPKVTAPALIDMKRRGDRITIVTAYDHAMARLADEAGVEAMLVGDSVGTVLLGYESTLPVTMEEMLHHVKAVSRAKPSAMVIGDLPFMSYQVSDEQAIANAGRMVQEGGADAVKLEGGERVATAVERIVAAGIPVMGHLGLTPQSATMLGGFKAQGRTAEKAVRLYEDALALEAAGCFAIVLEAVPAPVASRITDALSVPTIGIGAGAGTDGQVLVWHDLLGLYEGHAPRFVKQYADLAEAIKTAVGAYVEEVRERRFPEEQHTYSMPEEELALFEEALEHDRERS
jgi:3-methyl-2-oxobutanoate hydroxymethyltransferase